MDEESPFSVDIGSLAGKSQRVVNREVARAMRAAKREDARLAQVMLRQITRGVPPYVAYAREPEAPTPEPIDIVFARFEAVMRHKLARQKATPRTSN